MLSKAGSSPSLAAAALVATYSARARLTSALKAHNWRLTSSKSRLAK